jgi:hypothetical protein
MTRTTFALMVMSAMLLGCPEGMGGTGAPASGGTAGGEQATLPSQCTGGWGDGGAAARVQGFFGATSALLHAAADVPDELFNLCRRMGTELGMPAAQLNGDMRTVCDAVSSTLRSELNDLRAEANLRIDVVSTPPRCEVSMDAYAQCAAECDATLEPGKVDLQCEGGHIAGQCDARCQGECNVDVQGKCGGACEGSCGGSCQGTCNGTCDGQCTMRNADGTCAGRCQGTCHGSCDAGCQGECKGECWVKGQASCKGTCRGGCSVEYKAPYCTGEVKPPRMEASCEASCDAQFSAKAECKPGHTEVTITGDVSSNLEQRVARVRNALRAGHGGILAVQAKLQRLRGAATNMRSATANLRGVGSSLGAGAVRFGACLSDAGAALAQATGNLSVSMEVSVSVSASASGSAG